jgi:hypothetical protein
MVAVMLAAGRSTFVVIAVILNLDG